MCSQNKLAILASDSIVVVYVVICCQTMQTCEHLPVFMERKHERAHKSRYKLVRWNSTFLHDPYKYYLLNNEALASEIFEITMLSTNNRK